jgi:hypothetical protein
MAEAAPERVYFVWRPSARRAFRTYRATARRPVPDCHNRIWQGPAYRQALAVQREANAAVGAKGRARDDPGQRLLPGALDDAVARGEKAGERKK